MNKNGNQKWMQHAIHALGAISIFVEFLGV